MNPTTAWEIGSIKQSQVQNETRIVGCCASSTECSDRPHSQNFFFILHPFLVRLEIKEL